jgi:hypothetical protein
MKYNIRVVSGKNPDALIHNFVLEKCIRLNIYQKLDSQVLLDDIRKGGPVPWEMFESITAGHAASP